MPEIGEVEKLRRRLDDEWVGKKIVKFTQIGKIPVEKFVQDSMPWGDFVGKIQGYQVTAAKRIAKNLILVMSSGYMWHIHLSSTGWIKKLNPVRGKAEDELDFLHSTSPTTYRMGITLGDGTEWVYSDARTWGKFWLRKGKEPKVDPYLATFGPDWLYQPEEAAVALASYRGNMMVKDVLCDQKLASGVGNYLACEACFLAKQHPHSRWQELHPLEIQALIEGIRQVIREAMDATGEREWRVFNRAGRCCVNESGRLHEVSYVKDPGGQRGSYYCGVCQGEPRGEPRKGRGKRPQDSKRV